jgi:hypothetical protein
MRRPCATATRTAVSVSASAATRPEFTSTSTLGRLVELGPERRPAIGGPDRSLRGARVDEPTEEVNQKVSWLR